MLGNRTIAKSIMAYDEKFPLALCVLLSLMSAGGKKHGQISLEFTENPCACVHCAEVGFTQDRFVCVHCADVGFTQNPFVCVHCADVGFTQNPFVCVHCADVGLTLGCFRQLALLSCGTYKARFLTSRNAKILKQE